MPWSSVSVLGSGVCELGGLSASGASKGELAWCAVAASGCVTGSGCRLSRARVSAVRGSGT